MILHSEKLSWQTKPETDQLLLDGSLVSTLTHRTNNKVQPGSSVDQLGLTLIVFLVPRILYLLCTPL